MLTREQVRNIAAEMDMALKAVAAKYKMTVKMGTRHFNDMSFSFRVEAQVEEVKTSSGSVSPEEANFKRYAGLFGLSPDDWGKSFTDFSGRSFTICGLKQRNHKYPILASLGGKRYKFPAFSVKMALGKSKAA